MRNHCPWDRGNITENDNNNNKTPEMIVINVKTMPLGGWVDGEWGMVNGKQ